MRLRSCRRTHDRIRWGPYDLWLCGVTCGGYSTTWQTVVAWYVAVLSCEAQTLSENARWNLLTWLDSVKWPVKDIQPPGKRLWRDVSTTVQCHFCQNGIERDAFDLRVIPRMHGIERDAFELRVIPRMHDWQTLFKKCHPFFEVLFNHFSRKLYSAKIGIHSSLFRGIVQPFLSEIVQCKNWNPLLPFSRYGNLDPSVDSVPVLPGRPLSWGTKIHGYSVPLLPFPGLTWAPPFFEVGAEPKFF